MTENGTQLVLTRGIPASGKTTWARAWVAAAPLGRARVNRDDLRHAMFGLDGRLGRVQENAVTAAQHNAIAGLLRGGTSVVVDDTNLRAATVKALARIAASNGAELDHVDFTTPVDECVARDARRLAAGERAVGESVVLDFAGRYLRKGRLPAFPQTSGPDADVVRQYIGDPDLPDAWLFDVDGTLAHMRDRGPFEWHRVGEDEPDDVVFDVMLALREMRSEIVVLSGRDGSCRAETEAWLDAELDCAAENLFMREAGDMRKDAVVKQEIFWRDVAPRWNVRGVFDDRDQVVSMWRAMGLKCFQVAPGDF